MREHIRQMVFNARRATWTDPAQRAVGSPLQSTSAGVESLAAQAVVMARVASTMHMDQAARLRAQMRQHEDAAAQRQLQTAEQQT